METRKRIVLLGVVVGIATVLIYWFACQGKDAWVSWNTLTAVVLAGIAAATGAAMGSAGEIEGWTTWESVLAAVLAGVVGVLFWVWGLSVWPLLDVVDKGIPGYGRVIQDLFYGFWFLAAILVPYIVRRPGAAVAAEVVGALVSALLGSQWGLTVLISGVAQGGLAEVVFAATGYRRYGTTILILAAAAAAVGSWVVDIAFWYGSLQMHILILMLIARVLSAALFSGLLGRWLGDALAATGVLDNTALGRERPGSEA